MCDGNLLFQICDPFLESSTGVDCSGNQETLFGQIVLNKMVGIAAGNIQMPSLNPEIRKAIQLLHKNYLYKSTVFKKHLKHLANILVDADFPYALLKGAFLSANIYEAGQRTSNDIDILISAEHVSRLQKLLLQNGFVQGFAQKDNTIRQATRREIIDAKMNTGETVPFVKNIMGELLEVDINFSLDFKTSAGNTVAAFLENTVQADFEDVHFKVLDPVHFLLHLSCHLYKEATTYDWVVRRRDLMLYKFCDIYMFIRKYADTDYFAKLIQEIERYGLTKECYYTFENTSEIYPTLNRIQGFFELKEAIRPALVDFMKQILHPRKKKLFSYSMSFTDWFFCPDRIAQLKEIPYAEH